MPGESPLEQDKRTSCNSAPAFLTNLTSRLQDTHAFALKHQRKAQALQRKYYDKKRRPVELHVGDFVLRDLHTLSDASRRIAAKLAARRTGQYVIVQRIAFNDYSFKESQSGRPAGIAKVD